MKKIVTTAESTGQLQLAGATEETETHVALTLLQKRCRICIQKSDILEQMLSSGIIFCGIGIRALVLVKSHVRCKGDAQRALENYAKMQTDAPQP